MSIKRTKNNKQRKNCMNNQNVIKRNDDLYFLWVNFIDM